MNRADLRRQQKGQQKTPTYNMNDDQLKQVRQEGVQEGMDRAMAVCLIVSLLTLADEFGFGEKRLNRFIDRSQLKTDCLYDKWSATNIRDYQSMLYEQTGIYVEIPSGIK